MAALIPNKKREHYQNMTNPQFDWDFPKPHVHTIQVAEADIDGMGHANNACYVGWCGASTARGVILSLLA
jgi:hypothetical protein